MRRRHGRLLRRKISEVEFARYGIGPYLIKRCLIELSSFIVVNIESPFGDLLSNPHVAASFNEVVKLILHLD